MNKHGLSEQEDSFNRQLALTLIRPGFHKESKNGVTMVAELGALPRLHSSGLV